jgi:hypothetical protein
VGNTSGQAYALMVMTPIKDGEEQALRDYLAQLPTGAASPLARLGTTHLGRWLVLHDLVYEGPPQDRDSLQSAYLIFTSNFDGDLAPYLADLHRHLRDEADQIWGRCVGYPGGDDAEEFATYLHHNQVDTTFFFSAYGDATVPDVLRALDLRERVTALAIATQTASAAELRSAYLATIGGAS